MNVAFNPYVTGVRLSADQYKLIEMGLTSVAQAAKAAEKKEVHDAAIDLIVTLQQFARAGSGTPPELGQRFQTRFAEAFAAKDIDAMVRVFREWLATLIRMEPDPARTIADQLAAMALATNGKAQVAVIGPAIVEKIDAKLDALVAKYEETTWPKASEVVTYLKQWLAWGRDKMADGEDWED